MTALVVQPGRPLARPARRVVVPPSRLPRSVYLRRRVAVGALGLVAVLGVFGVAESVIGAAADSVAASESADVGAPGAVIARPGDTLWALARQYRGDVPLDRYLERLVQANGGASIRAGQTVVLP
jgi:nucleoid-associated protein YgaU